MSTFPVNCVLQLESVNGVTGVCVVCECPFVIRIQAYAFIRVLMDGWLLLLLLLQFLSLPHRKLRECFDFVRRWMIVTSNNFE